MAAFSRARACLILALRRGRVDLCLRRQCQCLRDHPPPPLAPQHFLGGWRHWLCFFFFFFGGGVGHDRQGEGRARGWRGRGRQAERVYWLVSLYSVDCDKFNCGSPLKADASPEPPPPSPLPLRLFPLSFSHALWGRSVWLDIRCLLRANGYSRCLFLLHG